MTKVNIKNGTPVGNEHRCASCTHGQFVTGYRESDLLVICTNVHPNRVIPFPVYECTEFWDRNRPEWEQMEKLALDFSEGRRKPTAGFSGGGFGLTSVVDDGGDNYDDEAATAR